MNPTNTDNVSSVIKMREKGVSVKCIRETLGISRRKVEKIIAENEVKTPLQRAKENPHALVEKFVAGESISGVAREFGIEYRSARKLIEQNLSTGFDFEKIRDENSHERLKWKRKRKYDEDVRRKIVTMYLVDGYTTTGIARKLNIPQTTVYYIISDELKN